ncbi:MAG: metallophosphoesterase, partial [Myxococcota bacterium]
GLTDLAAVGVLRRGGDATRAVLVLAAGTVATLLVGRALGWNMFALLQALAWAIFLHGPLVLAIAAASTRRALPGVFAAAVALVGVDAFFVEPRWLEVTTARLPGPALRVALVADLQTDHVGDHERAALAAVRDARPDLVLFAGDYLQIRDDAVYAREAAALNAALRETVGRIAPRLGAYAVRGDVDRDTWPALFEGTGVTPVPETRTFDLDGLSLTALAPRDAPAARALVPARDGFHVVLSHRPDYALTRPDADLLAAGHTHGGQVRLPGIGPLMTLSAVPRAWAAGVTALPWGGHLVVARGIGMERYDAPRLRFLCRPELVILELGSPEIRAER